MKASSSALLMAVLVVMLAALSSVAAESEKDLVIEPGSEWHSELEGEPGDRYDIRVKLIEGPGVTIHVSKDMLETNVNGELAGEKKLTHEISTMGDIVSFEFVIPRWHGNYYLYIICEDTENGSTVDVEYDLVEDENDFEDSAFIRMIEWWYSTPWHFCGIPIAFVTFVIVIVIAKKWT